MTSFGKRGLPPDLPAQKQPDVEVSSLPEAPGSERTHTFMRNLRGFARWGAVIYLLGILGFGLLMTIAPFDALRFWAEHSLIQNMTTFALYSIVPLVLTIVVASGISNAYFEHKRYKEQRASGKNPWPLYIAFGGIGLLAFLVFSSQSPLVFFATNELSDAGDSVGMTIAFYVGIGFLVARVLDYCGIGLSNE